LFPEFLTDRCEAEAVAGHVLRWLNDPAAYAECSGALEVLCRHVAEPGACARAARHVLDVLGYKDEVSPGRGGRRVA
jgi:lipid A disaccharide synthetase